MENNNDNNIQGKKQAQYSEDHSTGLWGVLLFFIVMIVIMLVLVHYKGF